MFRSFCTVNRSLIKFKNNKNCQLFKIIHKIVKSFKKLGLGTPPLKKREIKIVFFCYRVTNTQAVDNIAISDEACPLALCEHYLINYVICLLKFNATYALCYTVLLSCSILINQVIEQFDAVIVMVMSLTGTLVIFCLELQQSVP